MRSSPPLNRFARRVRLVRAWRGLAIGACAGGVLSASWALFDWTGVFYADGRALAALPVAGALLGGLIALAWPISEAALARSIDRRAALADRLATASERRTATGPFDEALRADAEGRLAELRPKVVYPFRFGRWQGAAMALALLTAAVFLLGNSPMLLNGDARRTRENLKQQGEKVERISRENFETPEARQDMTEAERRLADEVRKYRRDLDKARMSDEESLQRANDIAKKADDLMRQTARESQSSLDSAQHALDQMARDELAKAGMADADPSLAQMPDDQFQQAKADAEAQMSHAQSESNSLQSALDAINSKLQNPKLSEAERKALEAQKRALEKRAADARKSLEKARKDLEALKMSEKAREVMRRLLSSPLYKELQALLKKLQQNAAAVKSGDRPQITEAERREMQAKFDALIKSLGDQKAMDEYLKRMIEALKNAKRMCRCNSLCIGLSGLVPLPGTGLPGNSVMLQDIGRVNHSAKALPSEGKTQETQISGMSRPSAEATPYVEIKAPATVGNRSAVPYTRVLPSYRRKAESALDRQEIPKEDEKRVRAYFESLGH